MIVLSKILDSNVSKDSSYESKKEVFSKIHIVAMSEIACGISKYTFGIVKGEFPNIL
ncbi:MULTISPECIES: hypothetical protein [Clostridium]|uniref:hypothetical protein n=1 Tax=Clostridium TaxID=1485 RepID=UPI0012FD520D|nr:MULTISPECIES: hypothetical protein [Clostridium]